MTSYYWEQHSCDNHCGMADVTHLADGMTRPVAGLDVGLWWRYTSQVVERVPQRFTAWLAAEMTMQGYETLQSGRHLAVKDLGSGSGVHFVGSHVC